MTTAPPLRAVDPLFDFFVIKDRGVVFGTIEPDPLYEVNEIVTLAGLACSIVGIERFAIEPAPGRKIGLLLKPIGGG